MSTAFSDLQFTPHEYGWEAPLPNAPRLFGHPISIDIHPRSVPTDPPTLPPISEDQAALAQKILLHLGAIIERVEAELIAYIKKWEPNFQQLVCDPNIWLNCETNDGESWTMIVHRTDNPDFGYHAEFRNAEFIELWAGD